MAKATVQAALGPVCLKRLAENPNATAEEKRLAEYVLMICILSIILTAPIGAILISISGPKLLTKTKPLHVVEGMYSIFSRQYSFRTVNSCFFFQFLGWRRSHRPSLYDISIIDEEEDRNNDPELQSDEKTIANTTANQQHTVQGRPLPIYTVTK